MRTFILFSVLVSAAAPVTAEVVFSDRFERPFVLVPFGSAPQPTIVDMQASAQTAVADIYFLLDITGDMGTEIGALGSSVISLLDDKSCNDSELSCTSPAECPSGQVCGGSGTCIERAQNSPCLSNVWTGVGFYESSYTNQLSLQPDPFETQSALQALSTFGGTEELYEALLGVADPAMVVGETGCTGPTSSAAGCPSFRGDARRITIAFTSEDSDGGTTASEAGTALASEGITLIGVWSGLAGGSMRSALVDVVSASGSFQSDGATPLVFNGSDAAAVPAASTGIDRALMTGSVRVTIEAIDDPNDSVDATQFIDRFETDINSPGCVNTSTEDSDGDGFDDTFTAAAIGSTVCFTLVASQNDAVAPQNMPQIYPVHISTLADGEPLETRVIDFIVPEG